MKQNEAVRPKTAPSEEIAGGKACIFGAEWFTLSWIAGLLSAFLHHCAAGAAVLLAAGAALMLCRRRKELLCMICGAVLGMTAWLVYDGLIRRPLCALDGQRTECTGKVTGSAVLGGDRARYTLSTRLNGIPAVIDWYAGAEVPELKTGDTVTLSAELTRIASDYRYDTAAYQAGRGQYLRIYRADVREIRRDRGFSLRRMMQDYRACMTRRISLAMPEADAGLFCAMLFGDKSMLSADTSEALYQTGAGHITAVSGLHLVLFCMALGWVFRLLHLSRKRQFLLMIPAVLLFILLVDASASVYRAACMLLLARSAPLFGRRGDTLRSLCITMFACTVLTPYVIGSVSFWLSVSGVFGIGVAAPYLVQRTGWSGLRADLLELAAVALSVFPASVLFCGESSLIAPFSNLMILPFAVCALYLGFAFLLTGGLAGFLLTPAAGLCRLTRVWADAASRLPFSHLTVTSPALRTVLVICALLMLTGLAMHTEPRRLLSGLLACMLLLTCIGIFETVRDARELHVAALGKTQNSVLVISAEGCTVCADLSGEVRNPQYMQRYLKDCGIRRVDVLLCGAKNAAAYQSALQGFAVGQVILPQAQSWRESGTVCGQVPLMPKEPVTALKCGALSCTADTQNRSLSLTWKDLSLTVSPSENSAGCIADVQVQSHGAAELYRIRLCPEDEPAQNVLLRLRSDGAYHLQML